MAKLWNRELGTWQLSYNKWFGLFGTTPRNAGFWNLSIWFRNAQWLVLDFGWEGLHYLDIDIWRTGRETWIHKEIGYYKDQCRRCRGWRGASCLCVSSAE